MTERYEVQPPFIPANPLADLQRLVAEQSAVLRELVGLARETTARVAAMKALAHSMVQTHPDPTKLAEAFQDQMDRLADTLQADRIELYRAEIQQYLQAILAAVNAEKRMR